MFNIYAHLGGPAEEIVGREQSEKLDIYKVKVVFQVFKIPVPWVPMLMETKFARLFASDDIFTVKSVLFKTTKKCFFLIQKSWGNFHLKQLLHKKTVASFQSQAIYMEEVEEIKQLRNLTKNPQNQNPVMVLWNWKGNFKVCQTSWT